MAPLADISKPVTAPQLALASRAWSGFGEDTPQAWAQLLDEDIEALPFLRNAVVRMLEELPGVDGLSRTQRHILDAIKDGVNEPRFMFGKCQDYEDALFMGDSNFFHFLQELAKGLKPAIHGFGSAEYTPQQDEEKRKVFYRSTLRLTDFGRDILKGDADFAGHNEIDFWWGGALVTNDDLWRWDRENSQLIGP